MKKELIMQLLTELIGGEATPSTETPLGQNIVVLDRGFVYVGEVKDVGDYLEISNARNIRVWGTKDGLGELRTGPKPETKLDDCGTVIAPKKALMHLIKCTGF